MNPPTQHRSIPAPRIGDRVRCVDDPIRFPRVAGHSGTVRETFAPLSSIVRVAWDDLRTYNDQTQRRERLVSDIGASALIVTQRSGFTHA